MMVAPNYCASFRDAAHKVWRDMSEAEKFGLPRNEETTTEDLLLNLARSYTGRGLSIKAYTKTEESRTGGDWAFWFSSADHWGIGLRVQAKRLYGASGKYDKLFHQSDAQKKVGTPTPNQCHTLLSYADGLIPVYCFYNSDQLNFGGLLSSLSVSWLRSCAPRDDDWGISVASAASVRAADWGKKNAPSDFPMVPWHCLVCPCCWATRPVDTRLPNLVGHAAKQLFATDDWIKEEHLLDRRAIDFEPTDNTPQWIEQFRNRDEMASSFDGRMEEMNLDGIVEIRGTEFDD